MNFLTVTTKCPTCGHELDAVGTLRDNRTPVEGDLSVCAYCGALLIFTDVRLQVRLLRDDEFNQLPARQREFLLKVQKAARGLAKGK